MLLAGLTDAQIQDAIAKLPSLPKEDREELARLLDQAAKERRLQACRDDFLKFVEAMWPTFVCGPHHEEMSRQFQRIAEGKERRITISMPPRSGKSMLTAVFFPAWYLGKFPEKKILQVSHKAELAVGFGRQVRELFSDPFFQEVFPGVVLKGDNKAAGRWATNKGGTYYACGVGAGMAGFGADLCLIDDPHSDQEAPMAAFDPEIFNRVYEWYATGPRQRLQPKAAIAIIQTRWGQRDLIGRLLDDQKNKGADKWNNVVFPAIIEEDGAQRSYWPEFWELDELLATRAAIIASGSLWRWNAQYMQNPTGEEGALIKSEWWKVWPRDYPPACEFVIQAWDTANRATERSDYSVCTTWGVFYDEDGRANIILLDCFRDKLEFPRLKETALRLYRSDPKPDACIIEGKNSGDSLIFELRSMGLFVENFTPTRGDGDKVVRVNAVTDIFASGVVWIMDREWTSDVIDECQAFPLGLHDDIVDTVAMALSRFRRGNFIRLDLDEDEEDPDYSRPANYY